MRLDPKLTTFVERQLEVARTMIQTQQHPIFISWRTSKCDLEGHDDHIAQCLALDDMPMGMDLDSLIVPLVPNILDKLPKQIGFCIPTLRVTEAQLDAAGVKGETAAEKTLDMYRQYLEDDFDITPPAKLLNDSRVVMVLACDNRGNQIEGVFYYRHLIKMGGGNEVECDKDNQLRNVAPPDRQNSSAAFDFAVQHMMRNNDGT